LSSAIENNGEPHDRRVGAILVVDDHESNRRLLSDLLTPHGFDVTTAADGAACLAAIETSQPDVVLLDIIMPGIDGYAVCRRLRSEARYPMLPIVLITSLDPDRERVKGLEAGADDFLSKPINSAELLARVRSLMRTKRLYDEVQGLVHKLSSLNATLEQRVHDEVQKNVRLSQLKRFLPPQLADLIVAGGVDDPLQSHRQEVAVVFIDLRGFTAFSETTEPELVMRTLREFHLHVGHVIQDFGGTLERFTGDGIMVVFNDPVPVPDPARRAVECALAMRVECGKLAAGWKKSGFDLDAGIGIAFGYATLGAIGFDERIDYGAIGTVTNLASRLCAEAPAGQIYVGQRVQAALEGEYAFEAVPSVTLRGLSRPQQVYRVASK
jgi:adenylate cyclase